MEEVEKLFRHLVRVLSEGERDRSREPIEIAEIYQTILPYRRFRGVLQIESNQDYEMILLRLLSGEGGLASVDPVEAQDALSEEANAVNPNPGAFRDYAAAKVYLNINAIQSYTDDSDPYAPPSPVQERAEPISPEPSSSFEPPVQNATPEINPSPTAQPYAAPETQQQPFATKQPPRPVTLPFVPEPPATVSPPPGLERGPVFTGGEVRTSTCPSCDRGLPTRRKIKFCPYCGKDVSKRACRSCGSDVGVDWEFCVECGTNASA